MLLKAVGHHTVRVGGMLFALLTDVHLANALQVDSLEGSEGSVSCGMLQGIGGPSAVLLETRGSQGASDGLRGAHGKRHLLHCGLLLL